MHRHRINDIEFTLFDDGSIGIEVVGPEDVITRAHLYVLANESIRAQTGIPGIESNPDEPVDDGSRFV